MAKKTLITGGMGYIGSHTLVEFANAGHEVVVIDNFSNSSAKILGPLRSLCAHPFQFVQGDVRDEATLDRLFAVHDIGTVIHFAGFKAVGESVADPLAYFDNNLGSTLALLRAMKRAGVKRLVFSSSATVYGDPEHVPIPESARLSVTNPYGRTKLMCEQVLEDLARSDASWAFAVLRYFNPIGAHESGLIGEHPNGVPNNLMPYITQVASGKREQLRIFGSDYPTADGTGVRDYIHVVDLAQGHLAAARYLEEKGQGITVNLGTGLGVSVKQLVETFTRVTGVPIPHEYVARRPGDVAECYADTTLARRQLGWRAERDVAAMCLDAWRWQSGHPEGFDGLPDAVAA